MTDLHISLLTAALAAVIAIWLGIRCIQLRFSERVVHGDGGSPLLMRRMRAQANFAEYTPVVLLLVLMLDLAGQDGWLLAMTALAFLLGRVLHAFGMDSEQPTTPRKAGMILTFTPLAVLAIWAVLAATRIV